MADPSYYEYLGEEERKPTIRERFAEFHRENPQVYEIFEQFALTAISRGKTVGARMVWERMRWEISMETVDPSKPQFRLNDHFPPYYARLFMDRNPQHKGYFELRRVIGESSPN